MKVCAMHYGTHPQRPSRSTKLSRAERSQCRVFVRAGIRRALLAKKYGCSASLISYYTDRKCRTDNFASDEEHLQEGDLELTQEMREAMVRPYVNEGRPKHKRKSSYQYVASDYEEHDSDSEYPIDKNFHCSQPQGPESIALGGDPDFEPMYELEAPEIKPTERLSRLAGLLRRPATRCRQAAILKTLKTKPSAAKFAPKRVGLKANSDDEAKDRDWSPFGGFSTSESEDEGLVPAGSGSASRYEEGEGSNPDSDANGRKRT